MKALQDKVNVQAPDADFPFGDLTDDNGTGNGTPANRELFSDALQFFEKLMSEAGIVPNGILDNEYNGWQLYDAFRKLTRPYSVYTAKHIQAGTAAPTTAPVGFNDIGNIVWTRNSTGSYYGTLANAFPDAKTIFLSENGLTEFASGGSIRRVDDNTVEVRTLASGSLSDGIGSFYFEIRVYD